MLIIRSSLLAEYADISFGLSTKVGNKKKLPYFFNMSKSIGDDEKRVEENRKLFFSKFGLTPENVVIQKQIHSDIINIVEKPEKNLEGDALITNKPNIGLAISTADCNNIYLYDKSKKIISAIHSGWRGTEKKIVAKTLQKLKDEFNVLPNDLKVYVGPAISQENYEVDEEVAAKFDKKYYMQSEENKDKFLLDLKLANYDMLIDFGIPQNNIQLSSICSYNQKELHSYRRDKEKSGRALGIIVMKEL